MQTRLFSGILILRENIALPSAEGKTMDTEYKGIERRKYKRLPVGLMATYEIRNPFEIRMLAKQKNINTIMFDLSEGGASISTSYDLPASSILMIKFTLINFLAYKSNSRSVSMSLTGEVVYSMPFKKNEHRLGIRFKDINAKDKDSIASFIMRQSIYNDLAST